MIDVDVDVKIAAIMITGIQLPSISAIIVIESDHETLSSDLSNRPLSQNAWNKLKKYYCLYNKIIHVGIKYKKLNCWTKIAEIEIHCMSG